jgi:acid phosphatase
MTNKLSGVVGFPWLNATSSLLREANSSAIQDLYIFFTHRKLLPTVLVVQGLFNNSAFSGSNDPNATIPTNIINCRRAWQSSRILPCLTNIALKNLQYNSFGFDV